ncbi:MAG TPA: GNAT family N-acetyltransferase [Gemmatimonadaceae bacterium]|nr:GNAT family N-acetyltransferase [Gemmatimonadaceae bacterium]
MTDTVIRNADTAADVHAVGGLFLEYAARHVGPDLTVESMTAEIATLPGEFQPPRGRLLLAMVRGESAGCVGLRPLDAEVAEVKRLFVRPELRGLGIGRLLLSRLQSEARRAGYRRLRLDTINEMRAAIELYRSFGFQEIAAYHDDFIEPRRFFELELGPAG